MYGQLGLNKPFSIWRILLTVTIRRSRSYTRNKQTTRQFEYSEANKSRREGHEARGVGAACSDAWGFDTFLLTFLVTKK